MEEEITFSFENMVASTERQFGKDFGFQFSVYRETSCGADNVLYNAVGEVVVPINGTVLM